MSLITLWLVVVLVVAPILAHLLEQLVGNGPARRNPYASQPTPWRLIGYLLLLLLLASLVGLYGGAFLPRFIPLP